MMPKFKQAVYAALVAAPLACVSADSEPLADFQATPSIMPIAPAVEEIVLTEQPQQVVAIERKPVPVAPTLTETSLSPFTGKIRGKKVRLRLDADLESRIIRELDKNELVTVVGEKGNFYAVQPPANCKAYVFRSFVLDNVVEGNRVNIRIEPDMDAAVIGHFNGGERVHSNVASKNNKWLEIAVPSHVHFFVAKDYVENIGGPEVREHVDKRKSAVKQALENTSTLVKTEMRKAFDEIDLDRLTHQFDKIAADCAEFPELLEQVKDAQLAMQNSYLQQKVAYLETKTNSDAAEEQALQIQEETLTADTLAADQKPTDKMLLWQPVEEALYLNWAALNQDRNIQEFYEDQKTVATTLSGILEAYTAPVKNKPGDFVLKDKDIPVAYVYSTKINLQNSVGKRVKLKALPRPNNNFAFPAYFVLSEE